LELAYHKHLQTYLQQMGTYAFGIYEEIE